ncbi:amino acid adenylation domain-containing protein [Tumidithrix elongata RA019]|uniref:Amino acid adenylation domain-containing protein n=1 Tax=Tumidithrix elongata BACA0141 TaxID=2716417 RepID=A0AAW9Q1A4_9CYAN|nr:amino acid adenylation domain-containing protein [Tumidithrix elongata RA019]
MVTNVIIKSSNSFIEFPKKDIEQSIPSRFAQQVVHFPNHIAVRTKTDRITYKDLDAFSNRVAHTLIAKCDTHQEPIALLFEPSIQMVAAVLGVLKAGMFFLPLDPNSPASHNISILERSGANHVLTDTKNLVIAENLVCASSWIVNVDKLDSQQSDMPVGEFATADTAAYVLYTSGSTGKPKGVLHNHRNVLHSIRQHTNSLRISSDDRISYLASYGRIAGITSLWRALLNGATLCIFNLHIEGSEELAGWLSREGITIYQSVPTLYRHWVKRLTDTDQFPMLRLVHLGGEPVIIQDVTLFKQHFSDDCILLHNLGSTEVSTYRQNFISKDTPITDAAVPAGYPIEDKDISLIDDMGNQVGFNEIGEIVVRSRYLAVEYWQDPKLTRESFVEAPNGNGERTFRTGDLGRIRPDGCLEHLGRKDRQIKIRGIRIEPAEIEAVLGQAPGVGQSVVVVGKDTDGYNQLIGYVIPAIGAHLSSNTLRNYLREYLPEHMVPSIFVTLDRFPLTPSGKVDQLALPPPVLYVRQSDLAFVAPSNTIEKTIAQIWEEVLGVSGVGILDRFFDIGGNSLRAMQAIVRLQNSLNRKLPLQVLFDNPTIADLSQFIQQNKGLGTDIQYEAISPRETQDRIPLSFAQLRLWFLDQLEPNSSFYNMPKAVRLSGSLKLDVLQRALDSIVAHHEVLRTHYIAENGSPIQIIAAPQSVELKIIDLQQYDREEQDALLQEWLEKESQRPFNLTTDLMIRGCLLQLAASEQILLLVKHHIASDGWSMRILWHQLTQLYTAFLEGKTNPIPPFSIQYADYAVWQREWLSGEVLDTQLNYWKQQLAGANPLLELPTDRPRPALQTYRGASQTLTLPQNLCASIHQLCSKEGVTLYMILLTAFQILLYRYSQQEDIIVGSPIAGRNRAEVEGLIGFFVNTLVLRTDLSGNPSFQELLTRVRSVSLEAYAHQDLPFEKLVEELNPERSLSYTPLFQVMFALQNVPRQEAQMLGLTLSPLPLESKSAKFDLDVSVIETEEQQLVCSWSYSTDLFDAITIEQMARHFQTLLEGIVEKPEQSISELPLLTKTELHQLLYQWNKTEQRYRRKSVHELFEAQVKLIPEAIAIEYLNQKLSYRELNSRANQLASHLSSLGVGAEVLVGICIDRSLEMIVGLLGILKAGGAYVPLDPDYPTERLAYIIADAKISFLLTQSKWASQLSKHQAQVICLDSDWEKISSYSQENLTESYVGENLAYVIYTSGSTGKPKGVMITHQALSNFIQTVISEYEITKSDRLLQFASINFDVAVEEIYPSLCAGATLVLRTDTMLTNLQTFVQACKDWQLTVLNLPTAYYHQLAAELASTNVTLPESLRLAIIGGERVLSEAVKSWQEYIVKSGKSDRWQLINAYGPTETTVSATLYQIPAMASTSVREVPIGRPLAHLQTYILDKHLQPVPIGVPGELHIGGDSLARGYLNRPELTVEKFIANPFSQELGARLYKTGDLTRYRSDGNIEYLGRMDNQVKIRSFRIELGEIETLLAKHPEIRDLAVIVREDSLGDKRIVAYIVPHQDRSPTVNDLRNFLAQDLPQFMLPSAFVALDSLPLMPNGKVDRRSLPIPNISSVHISEVFIAPRDEVEQRLANIWEKLLGQHPIGIHDNFFSLGGHSLLSVRLVSEIEKNFNCKLSLTSFFQINTIAEIAEWIREKSSEGIPLENLPPGLCSEDYRSLLSHSAGRFGKHLGKRGLIVEISPKEMRSSQPFVWIGDLEFSKKLELKQPIYSIPANSWTPLHAPGNYTTAIATLLIDELLTVQPLGPYVIGAYCYEALVALEMAQQLQKQGKEVALLVMIDRSTSSRSIFYNFCLQLEWYHTIFRFHLMKLSPLSVTDKLQYISRRFPFRKAEASKVSDESNLITIEASNILIHAIRNYSPKQYSGKVALIKTSKVALRGTSKDLFKTDLSWLFPCDGWESLLTGTVDLHKIACRHLELPLSPYAQQLGCILDQCLKEVE